MTCATTLGTLVRRNVIAFPLPIVAVKLVIWLFVVVPFIGKSLLILVALPLVIVALVALLLVIVTLIAEKVLQVQQKCNPTKLSEKIII